MIIPNIWENKKCSKPPTSICSSHLFGNSTRFWRPSARPRSAPWWRKTKHWRFLLGSCWSFSDLVEFWKLSSTPIDGYPIYNYRLLANSLSISNINQNRLYNRWFSDGMPDFCKCGFPIATFIVLPNSGYIGQVCSLWLSCHRQFLFWDATCEQLNSNYPPVIKHSNGKWTIYRWFPH